MEYRTVVIKEETSVPYYEKHKPVGTGGLVAMKVGWLALLSILRQFSEQKRFATLPLPFGYFSIMSKLYFFTWKRQTGITKSTLSNNAMYMHAYKNFL
jgi:hypothetical protein